MKKPNHKQIFQFTTFHCRRSCIERQFIFVKQKFEQELDGALADNSLTYGVSKKILRKKQKLPITPKIGARPIIKMKLSWENNPEIMVRVMIDPRANVPVLLQSLVGEHKIPVVLRERAEIITSYNAAE